MDTSADLQQRLLKQLPVETRSVTRACISLSSRRSPSKQKEPTATQPPRSKPTPEERKEKFVRQVGQKIAMINQKIDLEIASLEETIRKMTIDREERQIWIKEGNHNEKPKLTTIYSPKETSRIGVLQIKREERVAKLIAESTKNEKSLTMMKTRLDETIAVKKPRRYVKSDLTPHVRNHIREIYQTGLQKMYQERAKMINDYESDLRNDSNYQDLNEEDLEFVKQEFHSRLTKMEVRMMKEISSDIDQYITTNLPMNHVESQKSVRAKECNYLFENGQEIEFSTEELMMIRKVKDENSQLYLVFSRELEIEAEIMRSSFEARVEEFQKAGHPDADINQARLNNEETIATNARVKTREFSATVIARTRAAENQAIEHMYDRLKSQGVPSKIDDLITIARKVFAEVNTDLYRMNQHDPFEIVIPGGVSDEFLSEKRKEFQKDASRLIEEIIGSPVDWNYFIDSLREKWRDTRRVEMNYLRLNSSVDCNEFYVESMGKALKVIETCAAIYLTKHQKNEDVKIRDTIKKFEPDDVKVYPRLYKLRVDCKRLLDEIQELDLQIIELRRSCKTRNQRQKPAISKPLEHIPMTIPPISPHVQKKIDQAKEKYQKPRVQHAVPLRPIPILGATGSNHLRSYKKYYQEDVEYQRKIDQEELLDELKNCPSLFS
ncbi:Hypothetical protein POVR1_LOCUS36 [uncultured virus]|nr:Hypothetical protein POVR1_LOCUS36 [uncultured virus]